MAKNKQFIPQSGGNKGYRSSTGDNIPQNPEDGDDTLVDIVEVKEQAEDFFEKNQTIVLGALVGIVLLLGGYLGYKYGYQKPKEKAGMEAMFKAEQQFKRDSFALALDNPGAGFEGFLDIIDNYGGTKASNLAKYYSGISYMNLGKFDAAIEYLNEYSANDAVTSITKFGALGDCYAELGDMDKAESNYKKAVNGSNEFLTPYYLNKLALLKMNQDKSAEALPLFERIANDFPQSSEARDAKKYVARLQ